MSSLRFKLAAMLLGFAGISATTTAEASQFGGMGGIPAQGQSTPATPSGNPKTAKERIALAQQALKHLDEMFKKGEARKGSNERLRWQERLVEAQLDAGQPKQVVVKDYLNALQAAEADAKRLHQTGEITELDLLDVKFRTLDAQKLLLDRASQPQLMGGMAGSMPGMAVMGGMGGGFNGGALVANINDRPKKPKEQHPADLERNKLIEQKLETPLQMAFPQETPLEDILKYIKSNIDDPKGKRIPIYVDPAGLQSAEKTMTSPVTLDLEDVPLRTTLRLVLKQLDLDYRVRDGMIYIDAISTFEEEEEEPAVIVPPDRPAAPGGAGGGFR